MGQIIFNEQKPKYANKLAITTGTMANHVLDENEIWLIDSTNATKVNGKGKYDKYIKGDGQTAAKNLPLLNVDPNIPTSLSELDDDATNRLVTEFSNYEIDMNSNYEINCMYNGQKWVIASAVIL